MLLKPKIFFSFFSTTVKQLNINGIIIDVFITFNYRLYPKFCYRISFVRNWQNYKFVGNIYGVMENNLNVITGDSF